MPNSHKKVRTMALAAVGLAALIFIFFPVIRSAVRMLMDETLQRRFVDWLDTIGPMAMVCLIGFQILQIVVAFLPGGLVELAGGMLYGPFVGLFISLIGIMIGTAIAFELSKRLGAPFVKKLMSPEQFERYYRLCASEKFETLALFLFFLPGVPKDILIYVTGLSGAVSLRFLVCATLVRCPSVIISSIAGSALGDGDFLRFAVIYAGFLVVGLLGMLIHRRILHRISNRSL